MFKIRIIIFFLLLLIISNVVFSQKITNRVKQYVLIDVGPRYGLNIGDLLDVLRHGLNNNDLKIGQIKIVKFQNGKCVGQIIFENENYLISIGDFIKKYNSAAAITAPKSKGEVNQKVDKVIKKIIDCYEQLESSKFRNTIAVLDFENRSKEAIEKNIGFGASELLTTRLAETRKFNIVERKRLNKIIDEIALGQTGAISEKSAVQAGKLLGADIIVLGSVSELGDYLNLNIRLIEVETGTILVSIAEEIEKKLMISSIVFIESPNYRIGISGTLHFPNGNVDYAGGWGSIEYSREISPKIFLDLELGCGPQLQLYSGSGKIVPGAPATPVSGHSLRTNEQPLFILMARLNYWLIKYRTAGVSMFTGIGLIINSYIYAWDYRDCYYDVNGNPIYKDYFNEETKSIKSFPIFPIGISLHLYQNQMVSFRLDFGYLFSLTNVEKEFPNNFLYRPTNISISPSGVLSSAKIKMYF